MYVCFKIMIIKKFASYITFWKKPAPGAPHSFNLKMMHGINKISILMFLIGVIIMIIKFAF
jgi:hypothetical protein